MDINTIYTTERGHALLWVRPPLEVPVVTLENYEKWYNIYIITPAGLVEQVPTETIHAVMEKYHDALWVDHYYHPRLLYRLAAHIGGTVDNTAVEVAAGRWAICRHHDHNFHDTSLDEFGEEGEQNE